MPQTTCDRDTAAAAGWRVRRVKSRTFNISSPWVAQAPGCPDGPHPTRDCQCKVFRTEPLAWAHAADAAVKNDQTGVAA